LKNRVLPQPRPVPQPDPPNYDEIEIHTVVINRDRGTVRWHFRLMDSTRTGDSKDRTVSDGEWKEDIGNVDLGNNLIEQGYDFLKTEGIVE